MNSAEEVDTGHFYRPRPAKCLVFLGILLGQESKIGDFLASEEAKQKLLQLRHFLQQKKNVFLRKANGIFVTNCEF